MTTAAKEGALKRDSDNLVEYLNAKDLLSDTVVNTATMTVTVETTGDVLVAGPIVGQYVSGTNGNYAAVIQDTIDWDLDTIYRVTIVMDGGSNLKTTEVVLCSIV